MGTQTDTLTGQLLELIITKYQAPADTTAETSFDSLNFDSLVLVEVAVALSGRYHTSITHEELLDADNVARTVALLEAKGVQP